VVRIELMGGDEAVGLGKNLVSKQKRARRHRSRRPSP
jgi:hypothetical protein